MKNILHIVFVVCSAALFSSSAFAQTVVPPPPRLANDVPANAVVLKLLQVGMPESVVLDKIHAITDKFDTSIDALVALKQAGATEAELKAIMAQGTASADLPPAAAPADTSPSLAETMQFIQDKLNGVGKISFVVFFQNANNGSSWTQTLAYENGKFVADPSHCHISYHRRATNSGRAFGKTFVNNDKDFWLRNVQNVVVWPYEQSYNEWSAKTGNPNIIATSSNPPITELSARRPHGEEDFFYFTDADLADRVAKAMVHAVELCGGGNKDKF
jgi:hypothetical protein